MKNYRVALNLMLFGIFIQWIPTHSISPSCLAQTVDFDSDTKGFSQLRQTGKLVTIELAPEGKNLRLKLVGQEAAQVKVDDLSLEATYGFGRVKKLLTVTKKKDEYVILRDKIEPIDLNIRIKAKDQVEDFDFRLK